MSKPIIGITQSTCAYQPSVKDILIRNAYYSAIRNAGGQPLYIVPNTIQDTIPRLDGVLFTGGGDINPKHYGEMSSEYAIDVDDDRDSFELVLFQRVLTEGIPFLGICRGLQLINIALGGCLYRDLTRQQPGSMIHDWAPSRKYLAHPVSLDANSLLRQLGFDSHFSTNSLHHQGINLLGDGLIPVAHAPDGLIEAVELTGHHFGIAVQWHPEWLVDQEPTRRLFKSFIYACENLLE